MDFKQILRNNWDATWRSIFREWYMLQTYWIILGNVTNYHKSCAVELYDIQCKNKALARLLIHSNMFKYDGSFVR